jgi:hypothetical protein
MHCSTTFPPSRADAVYCSPACKQKAYRRRVTGKEMGIIDTISKAVTTAT